MPFSNARALSIDFIAHRHPDKTQAGMFVEEPLSAPNVGHLDLVEALAASFAEALFPKLSSEKAVFAREMGRLAGRWHDLGKYTPAFQEYLRKATDPDSHAAELGRVDHSTAGAHHAVEQHEVIGTALAFVIAGHHAGLPDGYSATSRASLEARLRKSIHQEWRTLAPANVLDGAELPTCFPLPQDGFSIAFFIRMLFSCLTDADFLATEGFMSPDKSAQRPANKLDMASLSMASLSQGLDAWLTTRFPKAESNVFRHRRDILQACRARAEDPPGFFSLTVPTGGGKTFSSLSFALRHAAHHGKRRVIYAIPYTSIIEQNAEAFRTALSAVGANVVLEHHANLDPDEPKNQQSRLASENWDATLVVTTNVQFFESLFAHRPGRCRKVHHIAGSVIVLDEAQALPVTLLKPALRALEELTERYACTVVLCTATQPALKRRDDFPIGLTNVREIMPTPQTLFDALKRVRVHYDKEPLNDDTLAERLAEERQGMVVVNTRRHARELFERLHPLAGEEGSFHLSARLCAAHRTSVLETIRHRLNVGLSCCVVSTQLVEAGVDLDFPVVWRAMAGLSSLVQAAGRCNREGRHPFGTLHIFIPEAPEAIPRGELRQNANLAREVIELPEYADDPFSLEAIHHYFRLHYWNAKGNHAWDKAGIMQHFELGNDAASLLFFGFKTAAETFRLIEENQKPVIIPWDDKARKIVSELERWEKLPPEKIAHASRTLQRYIVTVPEREFNRMIESGMIDREPRHGRFFILLNGAMNYDRQTGLRDDWTGHIDPNHLFC